MDGTFQQAIAGPPYIADVIQAKWFVAGFIKPEGCIYWEFNTDESYWHTCANDDVKRMAELLVRIESAGAELFKSNVT